MAPGAKPFPPQLFLFARKWQILSGGRQAGKEPIVADGGLGQGNERERFRGTVNCAASRSKA